MSFHKDCKNFTLYNEVKKEIIQLIELGNFLKANKNIEKAFEMYPQLADIYYLKALLFFKAGDYKKAELMLKQCIYVEDKNEDYLYLLGLVKINLNDFEEALDLLNKAYEINSKNVDVLVAIGNVYYKTLEIEEALKFAVHAQVIRGDTFDILRLISRCYINSANSPEKSLEALKKARLFGKDEDIDFDIAKMMYICEMFKECLAFCKKSLVENPNSSYSPKIMEILSKINRERVRSNVNNSSEKPISKPINSNIDSSLNASVAKLRAMIGMDSVKMEVEQIIKLIEYEKQRNKLLGLHNEQIQSYHFIFTGNPGTGKTTVARLIGDIFNNLGLLKEGHVVEVDRSMIVGQFIGQTAIKTQEAIAKAVGGVLFVDEAYSLARGDNNSNDFGREAIETLLKAMEDKRGLFTVIFAGYTKEMGDLIKINPGLKSRINMEINFPDYSDEELLLIAKDIAANKHYCITKDAEEAFIERINREKVGEYFANARSVRNIIEETIRQKAYRISGLACTREELSILDPIDFGISKYKNREYCLNEAIKKLEDMVGMREVKDKIYEIKDYVETELRRKESGFKTKPLALHMQFCGNPGTGKTTVARILDNIFKAMGILKRGHLVEVTRADLVGQYIGQTAPKTLNKIREAYGGILFIDEAYSLYSSNENDFGYEAITTLIKEMEDNKDKLMVVFAGYPEEMQKLIQTNPGLRDRIMFNINFPDYEPKEMVEIFESMCIQNDYYINAKIKEKLEELFNQLYNTRDQNFGNARLVTKYFEAVKLVQAKRINRLNLFGEELKSITLEDVINVSIN